MKRIPAVLAMVAVALSACAIQAAVSLPRVFNNDMVLQRNRPIPVWGWADAGESVSVSLASAKVETVADAEGNWKVFLPAMKAGGPFPFSIVGKNTVSFSNVMVGEVWFCSGQSNMEMPINNLNGREAIMKEARFPNIRLFLITHRGSGVPQPDGGTAWRPCDADSVRPFSAAGYFFGRELHQQLDVPIGLIGAAVGGSRIEPWTPYEGFAVMPEFADTTKQIERANESYRQNYAAAFQRLESFVPRARGALTNGKQLPPFPEYRHELDGSSYSSSLFNGMVAPVVPYGIRGAIWYQGESNRSDGKLYALRMEALINGWRKVWGQDNFPFIYVQIAPYHYDEKAHLLPELWEAQKAVLKLPNTGMVVINDIGNVADIHPQNKLDVGKRLALWALAETYGKEVVYSGPRFKDFKVEGKALRIRFDQGEGLASRDGKPLTWFTLAGPDKKFVSANATIDGASIVLSSDAVSEPVAARFAWDQDAEPNLVNKAGLPTSSFRTDE